MLLYLLNPCDDSTHTHIKNYMNSLKYKIDKNNN